jgi:hypothetical protein
VILSSVKIAKLSSISTARLRKSRMQVMRSRFGLVSSVIQRTKYKLSQRKCPKQKLLTI